MEYQIISDGSCDLGEECAKKHNIEVVPFYVSFDGENYYKEIKEISVRNFYQKMVDEPKVFPKSSLPSVQDFVEAIRPHLQKQQAIICICITTKFSGSYNSAIIARDILLEEYPDGKIAVIDSTVNSILQGALVRETARMKANGLSFEETIGNIERIKNTGRIFFTIGGMSYLVHGGRVGKLVGLTASTLRLIPLIILKEGEIFSNGIVRTRSKSKGKIIVQLREYFETVKQSPDDYEIVVGYGYDYDEAVKFRDQLLASMKSYSNVKEIDIYQIGATIGVHTGPDPIGVALIKKYDK
jgi:DegV family protein with EDD domain